MNNFKNQNFIGNTKVYTRQIKYEQNYYQQLNLSYCDDWVDHFVFDDDGDEVVLISANFSTVNLGNFINSPYYYLINQAVNNNCNSEIFQCKSTCYWKIKNRFTLVAVFKGEKYKMYLVDENFDNHVCYHKLDIPYDRIYLNTARMENKSSNTRYVLSKRNLCSNILSLKDLGLDCFFII